jgi:hypothetical protein
MNGLKCFCVRIQLNFLVKRRSQKGRRSWNGMIEYFLCFKLSTLLSWEENSSRYSVKIYSVVVTSAAMKFSFLLMMIMKSFLCFRVVSLRNVFVFV